MTAAGFVINPTTNQPGAWQTPAGIPVDLMVPEELAGAGGRATRGARLPPHSKRAMRRATGLEAALVDSTIETVTALDPADTRSFDVRVAGSAALIVAKMHKLMERLDHPDRLNDKDAHDIYRILRAVDTTELADGFRTVLREAVSADVTRAAITGIKQHLAAGPDSTFAHMAGRAAPRRGSVSRQRCLSRPRSWLKTCSKHWPDGRAPPADARRARTDAGAGPTRADSHRRGVRDQLRPLSFSLAGGMPPAVRSTTPVSSTEAGGVASISATGTSETAGSAFSPAAVFVVVAPGVRSV